MPKCTICIHPQVEEINKELLRGASHRGIARQYALKPAAVDRHYINHIPEIMKTQVIEDAGKKLNTYIEELRIAAASIMKITLDEGDNKTALLAIRELHRIIETMAKMQGSINDGIQVNIDTNITMLNDKFRIYLNTLLNVDQREALAQWLSLHT